MPPHSARRPRPRAARAGGLAVLALAALAAASGSRAQQAPPPAPLPAPPAAAERPVIVLPGGEELDARVLRRLTLDIGFGREMFRLPGDRAHWSDGRLRRFQRGIVPVEVYSDDPDFAADAEFWGPFGLMARQLPALTGLVLTPRSKITLWDGPPGVMIFVGKRAWLRESLVGLAKLAGGDEELAGRRFDKLALPFLVRGRPICFAEVRFAGPESAELALSVVALEISPDLSECAYEEILQALGPINDSRTVVQTLFNDDVREPIPTSYDWLAFSILYDPRLKTGMTEAEAEPVVDAIIAELVR